MLGILKMHTLCSILLLYKCNLNVHTVYEDYFLLMYLTFGITLILNGHHS